MQLFITFAKKGFPIDPRATDNAIYRDSLTLKLFWFKVDHRITQSLTKIPAKMWG